MSTETTEAPKSASTLDTSNGVLSFDEIMAANDSTYKDIPVPEWGEGRYIRLQVLSADEAIKFSKMMKDPAKKDDAIARIVILCAVNPDGSRMMTGDRQLELFKKKSIVVIQRLQKEALMLNGFVDQDGKPIEPAAREAAAKND